MTTVAGSGMGFSKGLGFGPVFKVGFVFPLSVGGVEYMIVSFGALEQIKFQEAGFFLQISGTGFPNFLKIFFVSFYDPKAVHGNVMAHSI